MLGLCHQLQELKKRSLPSNPTGKPPLQNANQSHTGVANRCVSFQRDSNFWWQGYGRAAHRHNWHELSDNYHYLSLIFSWIEILNCPLQVSSFPSAAMWAKSAQVASQRRQCAGCYGNICQRLDGCWRSTDSVHDWAPKLSWSVRISYHVLLKRSEKHLHQYQDHHHQGKDDMRRREKMKEISRERNVKRKTCQEKPNKTGDTIKESKTWGRGWMTKASGVGERRKGRGELRRDCHHRVAALFVPTRMQQW